jgi:hypothetical protein
MKLPKVIAKKPCKVCEKILIAEMRKKHRSFKWSYICGHAFMKAWVRLILPKSEMEEDEGIRACCHCEKVYLRKACDKSKWFRSFYKVMDHALEHILEVGLTEEEKKTLSLQDPRCKS